MPMPWPSPARAPMKPTRPQPAARGTWLRLLLIHPPARPHLSVWRTRSSQHASPSTGPSHELRLVGYAGEQPAGDPGAAQVVTAPEHHQAAGGAVRPAHRAVGSSVRVDGHEHLRADPRAAALRGGGAHQELYVPAHQVHGPHAPQRHLPPRHQAGEHPHHGRHS
jgi:hypothetical protein